LQLRFFQRSSTHLVVLLLTSLVMFTGCGQRQTTAVPAATSVPASSSPVSATAVTPSVTAGSPAGAVTPRTPARTSTGAAQAGARAVPVQTPPAQAGEQATPSADMARLKIPALQVDAAIEKVGNAADGTMDIPKKVEDVAWYDLGPTPGELGNAVMAGHLDSEVAPAVFWRLHDLKPGDHVLVTRTDRSQLDFVVTRTQTYPYDKAPLNEIFGTASTPNLNLITCGGSFDRQSKNYSERLVVFTTLSA